MTFAEEMASAVKSAACSWLSNGGDGVLAAATYRGLTTPGGAAVGLASGLGLLALQYGCNFDPNKQNTDTTKPNLSGCTKAATGTLRFNKYTKGAFQSSVGNIKEVLKWVYKGRDGYGLHSWDFDYIDGNGITYRTAAGGPDGTSFAMTLEVGATCATTGGTLTPVPQPQPPVSVTTNSGCQISVEHASWLIEADGNVRPVVKISKAGALLDARASGGVIGGCNFNSVVVVGGGGDGQPPWIAPWQDLPTPDGGEPWWHPLVRGAAAGATEWAVEKVMQGLFGAKLPATVYRLQSACEVNAAGEPLDQAVEVTIPALPLIEGVAARVDALEDLMQGLKDFKQPICTAKKSAGQGVMVHFREATADNPPARLLDKRLSYKVPVGTPEATVADHWADFQWTAGPVTVSCRGTAMGQVDVWASTEAEARRVIAHAASSAGVDLAAPGVEWLVGQVSSPRYGRVAEMRTCIWDDTSKRMVSARRGSNGSPKWQSHL